VDVDCFILGVLYPSNFILTLPVLNEGWYGHENCDSRLSLPYLAEGRIEGWSPINERSKATTLPT